MAGEVLCQVTFCGVTFCGVMFCGVTFCGVMFCGVTFCGVTFCRGDVLCQVTFCGVTFCRGTFTRDIERETNSRTMYFPYLDIPRKARPQRTYVIKEDNRGTRQMIMSPHL